MSKSLVIDIRMIRSGGIGTYIREVIPALTQQLSYNRLRLLVENKAYFEQEVAMLFGSAKFEIEELPARIYTPKEQIGFLSISAKDFDLFWAPHLNLPWFFKPILVTVHDTFHLSRTQDSKFHERAYMRLALSRLKTNASAVIAVSEFSKSEMLKHVDYPSEKIHVIPHAPMPASTILPSASLKFNVNKPFVLFVGNLKPHKNLKTLVKAFAEIKDRVPHELWIAGHQAGMRRVDENLEMYKNLLGDRLRFLGRVDDNELAYLYKTCAAYVAPAVYEGFGLTGVEALLAGTRVMASDIAAHREAMPDGPDFFEPLDAPALSALLLKNLITTEPVKPYVRMRKRSHVINEHRLVFEGLGY